MITEFEAVSAGLSMCRYRQSATTHSPNGVGIGRLFSSTMCERIFFLPSTHKVMKKNCNP